MIYRVDLKWFINGKKYLVVTDEFRAKNDGNAKRRAIAIVKEENKKVARQGKTNESFKYAGLYKITPVI